MIPLDPSRCITQTRFGGDPRGGNCAEAACATLLGIALDDITDFRQQYDPLYPGNEAYYYWTSFENLFESKGYLITRHKENYCPECFYLASGKANRGYSHMVVMYDGQLAWDPHPDRTGLLSINHVWVPVPIDPMMFVRKASEQA